MGEIVANIGLKIPWTASMPAEASAARNPFAAPGWTASWTPALPLWCLPQNVIERFGVESFRTVVVTCADGRKDGRPVPDPLTIEVCDLTMTTDCIVGPPFSQPLIGQIIPKMLDLIPDPTNRTLGPRMPDYPLLNLK